MSKFATLSDEYISVALAAQDYFRALGYTISKEKQAIGYPYIPALAAKRGSTTVIIEVGSKFSSSRAQEWVSYCKSVGKDNRVAFATRKMDISPLEVTDLTSKGIGLYTANGRFSEIAPPKDIAIQVTMPEMKDFPKKLRKVLGPVYEKIGRNEPIDAFEEACVALESIARPYLWGRINATPPIQMIKGSKAVVLSKKDVDKMTLGALGIHFRYISNMNHSDSVLSQIIPAINGDRIKVAHKRHQHSAHIRRKAGQNLWVIITALRALI